MTKSDGERRPGVKAMVDLEKKGKTTTQLGGTIRGTT